MRLGIDLDGVCYPFVEALTDWAVERDGLDPADLPFARCWDFFKLQWGWTTDQYFDYFRTGIFAGRIFHEPGPTDECIAALDKLREAGHEIVIITHRTVPGADVEAASATHKWLDRYAVPYDELIITGDKVSRVDLLLDDAPHNVTAAVEAGENVVVWDQPWNRKGPAPEIADVKRVKSWGGFVRYVKSLG